VAIAHGLDDRIVHRDLKPENILVSRFAPFPPELKIGDFGIGGVSLSVTVAERKVTKDYAPNCFCTDGYASLEQAGAPERREPSDDVHALGVIWYELLTGETRSRNETRAKERLLGMGMKPYQVAFLQKCFDDENHRPKDAKELADEIRRLFPSLHQEVQNDINQIAERRKKGENYRNYVREVYQERIADIWKPAADQDMPGAQWLVGLCWELGLETDPKLDKYTQAASWFHKAAKQGNAEAQYCLACYQRFGIGGLRKREDGKKQEDVNQFLNTPISDLNFSSDVMAVRITNCLKSEGITTHVKGGQKT
jgi:serine/threonine protein kinase